VSVNVTVFSDILVGTNSISVMLSAVSPLSNVYVKLSPSASSAVAVIVNLSVEFATLATITSPTTGS